MRRRRHAAILALVCLLGGCGDGRAGHAATEVDTAAAATSTALHVARIAERQPVLEAGDFIDPPAPGYEPARSAAEVLAAVEESGVQAYVTDPSALTFWIGRYSAPQATNEAGEHHLLERPVYLVTGGTSECAPSGPASPYRRTDSGPWQCTAKIVVDAETAQVLFSAERGTSLGAGSVTTSS